MVIKTGLVQQAREERIAATNTGSTSIGEGLVRTRKNAASQRSNSLSYRSELVTDRDAWNQIVFARDDNDLVQGYEWGDFRRYAGYQPYRLAVRDGQLVSAFSNILVAKTALGALMYAPHGPVFADAAAVSPMIDSIRNLARETGAIMFRASAPISTYSLLMGSGFRSLADERIAWNTGRVDVILDLAGSLEDLRRRLRKKTRQYLERSLHRGVEYSTSLDPARLYPLLQKNAARVGFDIPPLSHYQALCAAYSRSRSVEIWFATYRGQDVAGFLPSHKGGQYTCCISALTLSTTTT